MKTVIADWLWTGFGVLMLLWVGHEVYRIVLYTRGRAGLISEFLSRGVWRVARAMAFRVSRQHRHKLLSAVGPILLPLLIIVFIALLIVGFALIYFPRMPAQFNVTEQAASPAWIESLYLSGTTLVTVGYGDIAPRTLAMRFVALAEGISGFALISLMVTYLLTVYGALERKRTVALFFYHQAGEGADVAGLITHYFVGGRFRRLASTVGAAARDLQGLLESHIEHPIINYFHPVEVYKSLPRMLFLSLEVCTVIRACLDPQSHNGARNDPEVRLLFATAIHVLDKQNEALQPMRESRTKREPVTDKEKRLRFRFEQTMRRLNEAGIETTKNANQPWEQYRASREEWEPKLKRFASFLGYDWEEITGDLDLQYAADEEQKEPQVEVEI